MQVKKSIKNRLTVIIMVVTLVTSTLGYGVFLYWYMGNQHKKALELAHTVGLVLGQDIAKLVLLNDVSAASDITTKLKSFHSLETMVLYNKAQSAVFQYNIQDKSFSIAPFKKRENKQSFVLKNSILKLQIDAMYQNTHLGYIELDFKVDRLIDVVDKSKEVIIVVLLMMVIISYLLAHFSAIRFTNPIRNLVHFLEKIELGFSLKSRIHSDDQSEFGKLYEEVNTMLERLEKSNKSQKIAAVAFETQSGMTITDKDQKILKINKAFTKITGYSKEEVIGQTPAILKSGLHDKEFYDAMYRALQKDKIWMGEIYNKRKDGRVVTEHLLIQSVVDENNQVQYYVASFLDITQQKLIEQKLTEHERMLIQQTKMAQMGEMLENIAHQWRQPLSMITTSASGLKAQNEFGILDNTLLYEGLDNITASATHLSHTVDDFRNFYKDDKVLNEFLIEEAIKKAIKLLISKLKNKNIMIIEEFDNITFEGYENELIQVFINILNNARDELIKRDNQLRLIKIITKKTASNIIIEFQDNAGGIPDNILPNIFESHFTTKDEDDGTGIGLYMSKMIVENMHGSIKAVNENFEDKGVIYKGAKFTITFKNHE